MRASFNRHRNKQQNFLHDKTKGTPIVPQITNCCPGRIRTLTGGTRIRRATITPQGNYFIYCKVMQNN